MPPWLRRTLRSAFAIVTMSAFLANGIAAPPPLELPRSYGALNLWSTTPGQTGNGSACPMGVGAQAFTAAHVAMHNPDLWVDPLDLTQHGGVVVVWKDEKTDLAIIIPASSDAQRLFPHPLTIAKHAPKGGEDLIIYGMLEHYPAVFYGKAITMLEDGELQVDGTAWPGSSGGCVCSLKTNELYAILLGTRITSGDYLGMQRPTLRAIPVWGRH